MSTYNLTNQTISSSFDTLLQIDSGSALRDGTGSLVDNIIVTSSYALTASFAENAGGGDTGSLLTTASNEFAQITFTKGDGTTFELDTAPRRVVETVINKSSAMVKGTPVYVSGSTGNSLHAYPADAGNPQSTPATFILDQNLDSEEEGIAILSGFINGVDTSLFEEGADIYLAVGGGYTDIQPTGSAAIQKLGNVIKSAVNGSGVISGAGRVNALPNITSGYAWVGDSNGVPQAVSTSSWDAQADLTSLNAFTQSQEELNTTFATTGSNLFVGEQRFDLNTPGVVFPNFEITGSNFYFRNKFTNAITQLNGDGVIFSGGTSGAGTNLTTVGLLTRHPVTSTDAFIYTSKPYAIVEYNPPTGSLVGQAGIFFNQDTDFNDVLPTNGIITMLTGSAYDGIIHIGDGLNTQIEGDLTVVGTISNLAEYATTGSNTFNGNQTINGDTAIVGNPNAALDIYANGGNFDTFRVEVNQDNGTLLRDWNGASYITWLTIPTNTGSSPTPIFNRGLVVSASIDVNGTTVLRDATTLLGTAEFNNTLNVNTNLINHDDTNGFAGYLQNPQFFSEFYGSALVWQPNLAGGRSRLNIGEKADAHVSVNAFTNSFDHQLKIGADSEGTYISDWDLPSYGDAKWIKIPQSGTPAFQRGLDITGSLSVSGSATINDNTNVNGNIIQDKLDGSNTVYLQNPNFFSSYYGNALQWNPNSGLGGNSILTVAEKKEAVLQTNTFSGSYDTALTIKTTETGTIFADWDLPSYGDNVWLSVPDQGTPQMIRGLDVGQSGSLDRLGVYGGLVLRSGSGITTDGSFGPAVPFDSPVQFFGGVQFNNSGITTDLQVTGSVAISEVMNLKGQDPLPAGEVGDLAVSGSALYFYDGVWKTVSLV